ncbi:site-specific integrase [Dysosmobacter sp. Sow4_B12]|uniref:site-specific integrase n=1 Tax=Dysosmobacter sp. Sow4_B12 TaxID=3438777 RepID=UPI003F9159CD
MKLPEPKQLPSGKWRIQIMIDGKRHGATFDTPEEAQYWASGIKTRSIEEDVPRREVTVKRAFAEYVSSRSNILSPSTIKSYKNIQENYFQSLMSKKAVSIKRSDIQKEINSLASDKSNKTIKNAIALLLSVLSDYTEIDARKLTYPARAKKEHAFLEAGDIAKLLDVCRGDRIEAPILFALLLGLRRSEICALEWTDIDFDKKTVSVTKALVPNEKNEYVIKNTTKTEKSRRVLEMPDYLAARLNAIQEECGKSAGRITNMNPNDIYNHFKVLCEKNKIPFVGIHGLRHTNASIMLSIGITTKLAMARGGWSNESTLQNIYQHVFNSDKQIADEKINEYFKALAPDT